jgi:hypothetical protein
VLIAATSMVATITAEIMASTRVNPWSLVWRGDRLGLIA